jgi:hypothetical protein
MKETILYWLRLLFWGTIIVIGWRYIVFEMDTNIAKTLLAIGFVFFVGWFETTTREPNKN